MAALVALAVLVPAACSGGEDDRAAAPSPSATPTRSAPSPTAAPPPPAAKPAPPRSVLSGRARADGPLLVVKVDNTAAARPQIGLAAADLVVVEPVEGGLTRLAAFFSSLRPSQVGPVRSARINDVELLLQFAGPRGRVALAFSGGQRNVVKRLRNRWIVPMAWDTSRQGYRSSAARPRPYNVIGFPDDLFRRAGAGITRPQAPGWTFGPPPPGGVPVLGLRASWLAARLGAGWSPAARGWALTMDGRASVTAEGRRLAPSTVVVQYVTVRSTQFRDVNGSVTPFPATRGTGTGLILRDGRAYRATWRRSAYTAPTQWFVDGRRASLAPGQVWLLLVDKRRPATLVR